MAVEFDNEYLTSWDGVLALARMQSVLKDTQAASIEQMLAFADFCERAIKNIDEVKAEFGGDNAPFIEVAQAIFDALNDNQKK